MLVSTKGRYALRVMIDLAEHNNGEYIPLKAIAQRQEISEKYLENIIPVLTKAGFLVGVRGKGGGYKLTREPEKYTVASILKLTEDTLSPISCLAEGGKQCDRAAFCTTLPMWSKLDKLINDFLEGYTIADLMGKPNGSDDYVI